MEKQIDVGGLNLMRLAIDYHCHYRFHVTLLHSVCTFGKHFRQRQERIPERQLNVCWRPC